MQSNTVVLKLQDYLELKKFKEDTESGKTYAELKNKIVQLEHQFERQLDSNNESYSYKNLYRDMMYKKERKIRDVTRNHEHLKIKTTKMERQNDKLKSENDKLKSMSVIRFVWFKISGKL
jgi:hypothetical protein